MAYMFPLHCDRNKFCNRFERRLAAPIHPAPRFSLSVRPELPNRFTSDIRGRLLRLPLYYDIMEEEQTRVIVNVRTFIKIQATGCSQPAAVAKERHR